MGTEAYDFVVVGQGLAGTALAWSLSWSGARVLVVDRDTPGTASRVAAGLITPITGQRLVISWRWAELWPAAVDYYRRVERLTGASFFRETPMVRLFNGGDEEVRFHHRTADAAFDTLVRSSPEPPLDGEVFTGSDAAFEMVTAGQLNVIDYLDASRNVFQHTGGYVTAELSLQRDFELADRVTVVLPRLGVTAKHVIFCQGLDATSNPWFRAVRFKPAKGEVLTLRIPGLREQRVVHRGIWLAPTTDGLYRAGATYEWEQLDDLPTIGGREEILSRLSEFLKLPIEVVSHSAAVRPIHRNQYPVAGLHPDDERLGFFNGLGSKGALHAPYFAQHFARCLMGRDSLDPAIDVNRRTELRGCHP